MRDDSRLRSAFSVLSSSIAHRPRVEKTLLVLLFLVTLASGLAIGGGAVYVFHVLPGTQASPVPAAAAPVSQPPAAAAQAPQPDLVPTAETDAERARARVRSGDFLPLDTITATLRAQFPGEIIGVKLDEDDGLAHYEFRIMGAGGRVVEVEVDPKTGRVIDVDDDD